MPLRPQLQIQPEFLVPFTCEVPGTFAHRRQVVVSFGPEDIASFRLCNTGADQRATWR